MPSTTEGTQKAGRSVRFGFAFIGVLLIAVNLRVSFVSVGPLLNDISTDLGLSSTVAGLLTGLPLIVFALFSPVAPAFARWLGLDRALWASLLILAAGIVLRSVPIIGFVWIGTGLVGVGIAFLNVLVPSLVKRDFPARVSQVTGSYTAVQAAAAAIGTALVVPIAQSSPGGWRLALGIWVGLVLVAMGFLLPFLRRRPALERASGQRRAAYFSPWKSALGWQVTAFMGLQSVSFYVFMAWLPSIEHSQGLSEAAAGAHLSLFLLINVVTSFAAGAVLHRFPDQRLVALLSSILVFIAYAGMAAAPGLMLLWIIFGALGCGSLIVVALSLFSLRTVHHSQAAALSGMAQSVGYAVGAAGPVLFGALHDWTGGWTLPLTVIAAGMAALCVAAVYSGRDRVIGSATGSSGPRQRADSR
ncbi:MFS transporter [Paenarthrobacter sp. PH39-S1]|uniref:MFS transporter n=1 Tax=Paenarthrobacter sp. PH39-S1 TaxID=3046204 RepID=UPI0024BB8213|nr:MFS transporter [Paenarthrobacter sp. PH39-S1]MDJ0355443.1 MFS transporter [Paenarthrobacter sp. PH39-S1]